MEDHNVLKLVPKNDEEKDPIVMYLIVRESLNMSAGKLGAQCGHATQLVLMQYWKEICDHTMGVIDGDVNNASSRLKIFKEWLQTDYRKVTLKADDKEWEKVKLNYCEGCSRFTVIDNGLTEVPAGSETVMALWPMHKSARTHILKRLQLLK